MQKESDLWKILEEHVGGDKFGFSLLCFEDEINEAYKIHLIEILSGLEIEDEENS